MEGFDPDGRLFVAATRPPGAVLYDAMTEFSTWDATADRAVARFPAPLEGMGWFFPGEVMAFHKPTIELHSFDARSGRLLRTEPLPDRLDNMWPATPRGVGYYSFADEGIL